MPYYIAHQQESGADWRMISEAPIARKRDAEDRARQASEDAQKAVGLAELAFYGPYTFQAPQLRYTSTKHGAPKGLKYPNGHEVGQYSVFNTTEARRLGMEPPKAKPTKLEHLRALKTNAARDDTRPVLTHVLVTGEDGARVGIAADGFKMLVTPQDDILPGLYNTAGQWVSENGGPGSIGQFPDHEQITPQLFQGEFTVDTEELYRALSFALAIVGKRAKGDYGVTLQIETADRFAKSGTLYVIARNFDIGETMTTLAVKIEEPLQSNKIRQHVNARYLRDLLEMWRVGKGKFTSPQVTIKISKAIDMTSDKLYKSVSQGPLVVAGHAGEYDNAGRKPKKDSYWRGPFVEDERQAYAVIMPMGLENDTHLEKSITALTSDAWIQEARTAYYNKQAIKRERAALEKRVKVKLQKALAARLKFHEDYGKDALADEALGLHR